MCPDCLKDKPIYAKEICKTCYMKINYSEVKQKKLNWWKEVKIQPEHKEAIRISLLRLRYSYEQPIDYMVLMHFYLMYKAPWMKDFTEYNLERTMDRIKPELKKIFK